jgi:hypothetical protein
MFCLTVIKSAIGISSCRNLQSLTLCNATTFAMLAFLDEAPTEFLHTLTFHIGFPEPFNPDSLLFLNPLAMALESKRFRRVNSVRFIQDGSVIPDKSVRSVLERIFADLHSRGVLRFVKTIDS